MDLTSAAIDSTKPWNDKIDLSNDAKIKVRTSPRSSSRPVSPRRKRRLQSSISTPVSSSCLY
ncbi:hypothetical protein F2Q68_00009267 [Brassica cretica]|uniref:Uncharacterized protein n=1 Tax=Brassica cretica TaxID=69181 RepID=A0A8S9KLW4_BRACR|nr:hypothetical protein F2Q68_00009267 [Brassica cretica]